MFGESRHYSRRYGVVRSPVAAVAVSTAEFVVVAARARSHNRVTHSDRMNHALTIRRETVRWWNLLSR